MSSLPAELSAGLRPARWPWLVLAVFFGLAVAGMVFVAVNGESLAQQVALVIALTMFGVVGALIVSRDRRNVIGGILLFAALVTAWGFLCGELTTWFAQHGDGGPLVVSIALFSASLWLFGILPTILLLPLLFPDGHLPSRRWRPFLWLIFAFLALLFVATLFGQELLTGSNDVDAIVNPFYIAAVGGLPSIDPVINGLLPAIFATSVASLFVRFRRSSGIERQQIKWVAFLAFPLSIGIAVLRFHLYDPDVVVKKAVVYAALALFATVVYLGLVVGLGTALGRGSSFLTMVAAVIVAVTFQPIRTRLTRFANRVVYGKRATPYEVLSEFSEQLVGETNAALEDLRDLARGIYPPLLADKGLPAALESQARKSGLTVGIQADGIGRYPQEVEAAVYFSCLEALQNVAKYATASSVTASLTERDGALTFAVTDDGLGFDPASTIGGTGLQGMADRLGAQDGELTVTSSPGRGTTIEGRLPLATAAEVPA